MSPSRPDAVLGALLTRTLEAKAESVTAPAGPFEPVLRRPDRLPHPERRPRWRAAVAVAAAVTAVAGAVGAAAYVGADDGRPAATPGPGPNATDGPATSTTLDPSPAPNPPVFAPPLDGVLAPQEVPDDLTLWDATWSEAEAGGPYAPEQLFTGPGEAGVVVQLQPSTPGSRPGGDPVTVRGLPGGALPAKEFPDSDTTVAWQDGDVMVSATFTGMPQADALAFVDGLAWRSSDRAAGFAPPDAPGWSLAAENLDGSAAGAGPAITGQFRYRDELGSLEPGQGRQVEVRTGTRPVSGASPSGLQVLMHATARPDGGSEAYDPSFGTLMVTWPDGRVLWIDANGTPVTHDELQAIADSVGPTDPDALAALAADARQAVADAMIPLATVEMPSATVTVRGTDGLQMVCVTPDGGDEVCPGPPVAPTGDHPPLLAAGLRADGVWWVVGVATARPVVVADPMFAVPGQATEVPGERGVTSDGRNVVVARPDATVTQAGVRAPGATGLVFDPPA